MADLRPPTLEEMEQVAEQAMLRALTTFESEGEFGAREQPWFTSSAGVQYTTETDQETGDMLVRGHQDVTGILERNHALYTENRGYTPDKSLQRVASIPMALCNHIFATEGWDPNRPDRYPERWKRLMNDIDYRKLRTGGGYV